MTLTNRVVAAYTGKTSGAGITEEGRRKYFEFPYDPKLKDVLKGLGAKWDPDTKRWWASKTHKNITKMEEAFNEQFSGGSGGSAGKEIEFEFPYDTLYLDSSGRTQPLREVLKVLGAQWDRNEKVWWTVDTHKNFNKI